MAAEPSGAAHAVWTALGVAGAIIFYGRFYVQWIASEIKKRSVIPIAFWYMSSLGSVMLLVYAVYVRSPIGALGQSFNIVVYSRNLVHIWRGRGRLSRRLSVAVHLAAGLACLLAILLVVLTWRREYHVSVDSEETARTWFWLAVGLVGQVLFGCRFLVQWIATERQRKSVVPTSFWHLSVIAAALQMSCFVQRAEWVFAAGMLATILIYIRNLWFIHLDRLDPTDSAGT